MSEPQATRDPVAEFLSVLGAELTLPPSELSVRRQVEAAAATARGRRLRRRGLAIRSGAVAAAAAMLLGTSGVAFAGGLPRQVQTLVADAAHMLPVPLPIPYPTAPPLDELPQRETPHHAASHEDAVTEGGSVGSDVATHGSTARANEPVSDDPASPGTSTGHNGEGRDARLERYDSRGGREDGSFAGDGQWDGSNDSGNRGWDDWRDHGRRGEDSNDRGRHDNDPNHSRDDNRDR